MRFFLIGLACAAMAAVGNLAAQGVELSAHQEQQALIEAEQRALAAAIGSGAVAADPDVKDRETPSGSAPERSLATPGTAQDFIVFGYAQSYGAAGEYTDFYRWNALTHVGSTFVSFDSAGNINAANQAVWTGRDAQVKAGGAAQAAGVKVIMVVLNSGFSVAVINSVMTTPAARTELVNDIVALLAAD